jgi:Flp pilus assembly protein TadG
MTFSVAIKNGQFGRDEQGAVAIMFGLMFLALWFIAGIAIDYGRVVHTESKFIAAADAASLAGGRALLDGSLTDEDVKALAAKYFEENVKVSGFPGVGYVTPEIAVDRSTGKVTVSLTAEVGMTMTAAMGFDKIDVPVYSSVQYDQKNIELGMALDTTGSMKGQKIADLKSAANTLVDILIPESGATSTVRIGLAPYAAAINLGSYADDASNNASIDGCVWERTGGEAYTDTAPQAGAYFNAGAVPKDVDPTEGVSNYSCPKAKLLPLTSDRDALKTAINGFKAEGYTAGHIGTQWAWNLISPLWDNVWPEASKPVAYTDKKTLKAIILMTDGLFNTAYGNDTANNQALALCENMKGADKGVVVFAVGFKAPESAKKTLRSCASSENHYFEATDGNELMQAFTAIGRQLNKLRLTS